MAQFVKMKVSKVNADATVLVEVPEGGSGFKPVGKAGDLIKEVDASFDNVVQHEIVENCRVLLGAFEQLKTHGTPPAKATAEFGLKFTAEGNVYVVKTSAEASFKITVEWQFTGK
jgi:hypothetical protein